MKTYCRICEVHYGLTVEYDNNGRIAKFSLDRISCPAGETGMKLGVIADIHADLTALQTALAHLDTVADMIICAGDLAGYGKQPNEVIECIRERNIITVKGNHDSPSKDISPENAEYLRQLPMSWRKEFDGTKVYMCHGVPGANFMGFTRKDVDDEYVDKLLKKMKADIMIAGHTHQPHVIKVASGIHFNPGSLHAIHRDFSSHSYGIITLPDMLFEIWDVVSGEQTN